MIAEATLAVRVAGLVAKAWEVISKGKAYRSAKAKRDFGVSLYEISRRAADVERTGRAIVEPFVQLGAGRAARRVWLRADLLRQQYFDLVRLFDEVDSLNRRTGVIDAIDPIYVATLQRVVGEKRRFLHHILVNLHEGEMVDEREVQRAIDANRPKKMSHPLWWYHEGVVEYRDRRDRLVFLTAAASGQPLEPKKARAYSKDAMKRLDELRRLTVTLTRYVADHFDMTEIVLAASR